MKKYLFVILTVLANMSLGADQSQVCEAIPYITYESWKCIDRERSPNMDIVQLRNGDRLRGTLETHPSLKYSFGDFSFEPGEMTVIAFGRGRMGEKAQVITYKGHNFVGRPDCNKIVFSEYIPYASESKPVQSQCNCNPCHCTPEQHCGCMDIPEESFHLGCERSRQQIYSKEPLCDCTSQYERRRYEIDVRDINYVILHEGNSTIYGEQSDLFSLEMTNGDQIPVEICGKIRVNTGLHVMCVAPKGSLDMQMSGGARNTYTFWDSLPRNFEKVTVEDDTLTVKIADNRRILTLPWKNVLGIHGENGGFNRYATSMYPCYPHIQ